MSDLYDAGILLWSEHPAALLKHLAASERLNERSQLATVDSIIVQRSFTI